MFHYIISDRSVTYKTEILCSCWLSGRAGRKKYLARDHDLRTERSEVFPSWPRAKHFPHWPHQIRSMSILSYDHELMKISTYVGRYRRAYGHMGIRAHGHTGIQKICNRNFSFLFRLAQRGEGNNLNTPDLDTWNTVTAEVRKVRKVIHYFCRFILKVSATLSTTW